MRYWWVSLLVVLGLASRGHADPESPEQDRARALFAQANEKFEDNDFVAAADLYRQALSHWDRPVIRFNLAVTLIQLDRSREAFDHLEKAMVSVTDLGEREVEARNYWRLLRARLSVLIVHCDASTTCELDGTRVSSQGQPLMLEPGSHALVAQRPGYETWTQTIVLEPGGHRDVTPELVRPRTRLTRRWSAYKPWLATGIGIAVALAGAGTLVIGNAQMGTANAEFRGRCPDGCDGVPADIADEVSGARLRQRIGLGGIAVGGVAVMVGFGLVFLNQPRAELVRGVNVVATGDGVVVAYGGSL